jgi:hypothetical protein
LHENDFQSGRRFMTFIEFPAFSHGLRSSNSFPMRLPMTLIAKVISTAELS